MKELASIGGIARVALVGWVLALPIQGHAAPADPMADITDVYAWMSGSNLNLVMDLSPLDDGSHSFGPQIQYVFHLTSKPGLGVGVPGGSEARVILRFASSTRFDAWLVDAAGQVKDYATGDPSAPAGASATDGKLRVFAGRRADPRFFSTTGFAAAIAQLGTASASATRDAASCPAINAGTSVAIRNSLMNSTDAYLTGNVMAIVVQLDKALVNAGSNTTVAVWGSSHAGT